jgi:uncharacterized paraquat-inducible protein A
MSPIYQCTACGTCWTYLEIRYVARCKRCGAGLTTSPQTVTVRLTTQ